VEDVASATVAAVERGRPGEAYNVVDDEPVSLHDFLTELARVGGAPRPRSIPLWLAKLAAPYPAAAATMTFRVSNEKAKRELGWTPGYPTYREGIRATLDALNG
jgi:nucleoside-diphosphate-sugar epimerase